MTVFLAAVNEATGNIYVDRGNGIIVEYNLHMYAAALDNEKYWEDAEVGIVTDKTIPELVS